jgi:hypothetical protein
VINVNLNNLAKEITLSEGLKQSVSIAQVKEIMKLLFVALSKMTLNEVTVIFKKYSK